ncbi:hypothetical protein O7606_15560 [Micromonospora sp. WMMD882]|nr:hypothetical protein [Micromonospora sp. WMMD882]WBB77688.1 hypothetical protein O7606_15560 [Micromonospora sp. WMMD882]
MTIRTSRGWPSATTAPGPAWTPISVAAISSQAGSARRFQEK